MAAAAGDAASTPDSSLMSVRNALIRTLCPFPRPYVVLSIPDPPLFKAHLQFFECFGLNVFECLKTYFGVSILFGKLVYRAGAHGGVVRGSYFTLTP